MTSTATQEHPADICLLLRVYGEQRWLMREVLPALREAERPGAIDAEDLTAAVAYLEMLWSQACLLASATDMAAAELHPADDACSRVLVEKAQRYHAAIRRLRVGTQTRVQRLAAPLTPSFSREHATGHQPLI
jgi:hypothetical protein